MPLFFEEVNSLNGPIKTIMECWLTLFKSWLMLFESWLMLFESLVAFLTEKNYNEEVRGYSTSVVP